MKKITSQNSSLQYHLSRLLIGYDQSYVTYIETATGNRTAISYEQMDSLLAGSGRTFISALE